MSTTPDHYEVLGVSRDASTEDIERARKRLVRYWHPDRNKREDAARHFDEVQKAAEVLRDPRTRAAFDRDFALQAAMSIPRDLRDRQAAAPSDEPVPPPEAGAAREAAPSHRHPPAARGSRKTRLWAGAAVVAVLASLLAVYLTGLNHAAPPAAATGPAGGQASPSATSGATTGTFPLPAYASSQAVLPVNDGQVLSIGPTITLLSADGRVIWHETASVGALAGDVASGGGPRVVHGCVVAGDTDGHDYDFISLPSGQQDVVAESPALAADSFGMTATRVALPDGTIRDPCTGAVLSRAAPNGTFSATECLAGAAVIGTGGPGQVAWANGRRLWQQHTSDPVICDNRGSALMLNAAAHKISLINPLTGRARWTVADPGCPRDCVTASGAQVHVLGSGGSILLSTADQMLALARGNGKLLWSKPSECALAARVNPTPEVLLGACAGQAASTGTATVASSVTGEVITSHPAGGSDCGTGGEWAASARQLLVVCSGSSTADSSYEANLTNW